MTFLEKLLRRRMDTPQCPEEHCKETAEHMLRTICSGHATEEEVRAAIKKHFRAMDQHTRRAA